MLSREEFNAAIAPLKAALEARRQRFLRYFYAGVFASLVILAAAMLRPEEVLLGIERLFHMKKAILPSDVFAFRLFAALCPLLLALGPVFSYRSEHGFSVIRAAQTRILGLFGSFVITPGGGLAASDLRASRLCDPALDFYPEEGAIGQMNAMRLRLTRGALESKTQANAAFAGWFLWCDFMHASPARIAFKGRTLLLPAALPVPGKSLQPWSLPSEFASLSAYSSDAEEARHILQAPLLESLVRFSNEAAQLPAQREYWDEGLTYAAGIAYGAIKEAVISLLGKNELPAEREWRRQYEARPRLSRPRSAVQAYAPFALECGADFCLALLPCQENLLSPGSLFAPACDARRMALLYALMEVADALTKSLA